MLRGEPTKTIGDARAGGEKALTVHCLGCYNHAVKTFEELKLWNDMIFVDVPKRRLVGSKCGSRNVFPDRSGTLPIECRSSRESFFRTANPPSRSPLQPVLRPFLLPHEVLVRHRLKLRPILLALTPRSNRAISPPRVDCLNEPQTVMMGRLGSCSLKPTIPRCWPAGGSLGSSPTWRRQRPCTRRLKGAVRKANVSVCLPFDTRCSVPR